MTKRIFAFDEICNGCQSCVFWCAFACQRTFNRADSKIRIAKDLNGNFDMPIVDCTGCSFINEKGEPLCVEMCPTGALTLTTAEDAYRKRIELHEARAVQPVFKLIAPWKYPYPWKPWTKVETGE